ncbi:MAG TPA: hypothetical protein VNO87_10975 [Methylomirabilota bacterium]|nr:hypothetical protein [Methylomirabilota bacterium]
MSIRIVSVPPAVLFQSCLEHQIGVLLDWHRVMHEIEYLVKGFLRVVLESNVMPCILGDQLSKSRELAPKNSFRACSVDRSLLALTMSRRPLRSRRDEMHPPKPPCWIGR